jgi:Zn-dependent protease
LGGAKPVPVNPRNYRNFKRGDIIVSLAGVTVNFLIAVAAVIVFVLAGLLGRGLSGLETTLAIVQAMMVRAVEINLLLLAFNLIPIPPLDGSHVMKYILPLRLAVWYQQVGRYGIVILVLLLSFGGSLLNTWLAPAFSFGELLLRFADPYKLPSLPQWLA